MTVIRGGFGKFFDMGNTLGSNGFNRIGFTSSAYYYGDPFPLTSEQVTLPPPSIAPPYTSIFGFDPHLKLPYTLEWNFAIEQALGKQQCPHYNLCRLRCAEFAFGVSVLSREPGKSKF